MAKNTDYYVDLMTKTTSRFRKRAKLIFYIYQALRIVVVIGSAVVPFILIIASIPKITATIVSAIVAVSIALTNYYNFIEHSINLLQIAQKIERERDLFLTKRGSYKGLTPGKALDLFMDNMDIIETEHNNNQINIIKSVKEKEQIEKSIKIR